MKAGLDVLKLPPMKNCAIKCRILYIVIGCLGGRDGNTLGISNNSISTKLYMIMYVQANSESPNDEQMATR